MTREPRSCPRETRTCTRETRTCTRLPATPEPVPKGAELLFDETPPEPTEYGAFERDRLGPGGYSDYSPGAIGIIQPGSTHGSSPQTLSPPPPPAPPPLPSPFLLHHTHHHTHNPYEPQLMAMDMAPRTRLRSRSGYYQQYGSVNSNGTTSTGVMVGAHHHHHHPYQLHHQQQQQQQQHNAVCAQLAYNNNNNNNNNHHHHQSENQANQTPSGDNSSSVIQRLAAPTGAHLISAEGEVGQEGLWVRGGYSRRRK
ncbi:hypothetical protein NHX12_017643 [Muraenolepis orangiensis]|uniref:Uncharacterized protein n=1 Tax=Muraenolepis orangiensis TaxID=630683 RepID=A0A9Q0IYA1_9TELE|nr:hypothetical protein NHX12_017643 [Muraenolepis orangiensis]